jgi:O-antigen/teichoic acid export membrane protein
LLLLVTPSLLHRLGPGNYGLWMVSVSALGVMGAVELGLGTTVAKFVAEYRGSGDLRALSATTSIAFALYLLLGVMLTAPLFFFAPQLSAVLHHSGVADSKVDGVVRLTALGLLPLLMLSGSVSVAVGLQRFGLVTAMITGQNAATLLVAFAIAALGGSVRAVVAGSVAVLTASAAVAMTLASVLLHRAGARFGFDRAYMRRTLSFTLMTGISGIGTLLFQSVDRVVVGAVLGLRTVAYYSITVGIAGKMLALADAAARPLMPMASAAYGRGDVAVVRDQLRRWTTAAAVVAAGVTAIGVAAAGPFLHAWLGEAAESAAATPLRILIVVYALCFIAVPGYHVANGVGHPALSAAAAVLGGAGTIALIVVLGKHFGLNGAALANGAYLVTLLIPFLIARVLRKRMGSGDTARSVEPTRPRPEGADASNL